jgi:hypothetical protein
MLFRIFVILVVYGHRITNILKKKATDPLSVEYISIAYTFKLEDGLVTETCSD